MLAMIKQLAATESNVYFYVMIFHNAPDVCQELQDVVKEWNAFSRSFRFLKSIDL